ncbi:stage III sporulation protein AF [Oxobacter pfennigii]|uniref:Stage III sporulation protein AF n=1 Tax=Oxobacter pfennigii TaxID=36849 RepID=A0A0P8WB15_9CLOT|nr:stage III sporulation protein AF [Oxobacter pfennigii]KPU44918.1 stage III sporulation protein AF [Oxobacter pfennigii]
MIIIEELKKYIYTIVVVMIFVSFIEILLPNSSMKKYSKMILGLMVMTVILHPVLSFLSSDYNLTSYSFKFQNQLDSLSIKNQSYDYSDKQAQSVTKLYKENLETQMKQQIKSIMGDKDIGVKVEIIEDIKAEDYGQITKVILNVENTIKTVEKINIGSNEDKTTIQNNTAPSYENLKERVSSMYGIEEDKIIIIEG